MTIRVALISIAFWLLIIVLAYSNKLPVWANIYHHGITDSNEFNFMNGYR